MDPCAECGFEYDEDDAPQAAASVRAAAAAVAAILRSADHASLSRRPEPATWSRLEYGCHLRDVLLIQRERVLLARRADTPALAPMGRDDRVEHDGYGEQDPADVARQLEDAALLFGNVLDRLGDDWRRTLVYNWPEPTERSLRWVAVHTVHEMVHHLGDMG